MTQLFNESALLSYVNIMSDLPDDKSIEGIKYTVTNNVDVSHSVSLGSDINDTEEEIEFVVTNGTSSSRSKPKRHLGVYTVENAVEAIGFGPFQIVVTIFTGMIWVSHKEPTDCTHSQYTCSYLQLSDAMEVMLLAVLSPILKCDWDLAPWQQAMLTSVSPILK